MFETKYRVVPDYYAGYEVQYRRWWMPFWRQVPYSFNLLNTSFSTRQANNIIEWHKNGGTSESI